MRWLLCVVVSVVGIAFTWPARATVVGCEPYQSGNVTINHCSNHNYFPSTLPWALRGAVFGLAQIRQRMVDHKLIEARPILIELPAFGVTTSSIARRGDCIRDTGESETPPEPMGDCYRIATSARDYDTLAGLVLALRGLSRSRSWLGLPRLEPITRAGRQVRGIGFVLDTIPSPDGTRKVTVHWRDGNTRMVLRTATGGWLRRLAPLRGAMAARPTWSADGELIARASLGEVLIHRRRGTPSRVPLTPENPDADVGQVKLAFDADSQQLVVSQAGTLWDDEHSSTIDLRNGAKATRCSSCSTLFRHHPSASQIAAEIIVSNELR